MKPRTEIRRRLAVVAGFATFATISLVVTYLMSGVPSPQQACEQKCASSGKSGKLVYNGPVASKPGLVKDVLFSECQCQ